MATMEARHIGITIDCPFKQAYAFAHKPESFPKWAAGLSSSLHRTDDGWITETPAGQAKIVFSPENQFGVLDHAVQIGDQPEIYVPLRMMPNGDGIEVVLTLLRQPDMDDDAFARDAGLVEADLRALRALLER
jgi:hypothetical protein